MRDDILRQRRSQTRDMRQQRRRGHVQIDTNSVHRVLDHGGKRLRQLALIDVVLVLPHANRLRFDLDQFGQRVLQPPRNRHSTTDGYVDIRKLQRGQFRGGIDRSPGL